MIRNRFLLVAALLITESGCSESLQPGTEDVAGDFVAQRFEWVDGDGTPHSLLETMESRADLVLRRNGSFHADLLRIPVALTDGGEGAFRVTGRWSYVAGELTLQSVPSSFLNLATFTVPVPGTLESEFDANGTVVRLRLVRVAG
jgi:hypothetical protein